MAMPSTPQHAKRELLRRYLAEWHRAVAREIRYAPTAETPSRVLYLEAFAVPGRAVPGPGDGPALGPLAALKTLDALRRDAARRGRKVAVGAVLIEEDPAKIAWLLEVLDRAGLAERTRVATADAAAPQPDEVVVIQADFAAIAPAVEALAAEAAHLLAVIDPPAPGRLPFAAARGLATLAAADLLIYLPLDGLEGPDAFGAAPVADLPPRQRRLAEGYAALLGEAPHHWLARWRAGRASAAGAVEAANGGSFARDYRIRLLQEAPDRFGKTFRLEPCAIGMLHPLLVSHDPARLLAMNSVIHSARGDGVFIEAPAPPQASDATPQPDSLRWVRLESTGALDLFATKPTKAAGETRGAAVPRPLAADRLVDVAAVAHHLALRFAGRTIPLRDIFISMLATDLFPDDVRRALTQLKRDRRATYRALNRTDEQVEFADGPRMLRPMPHLPAPALFAAIACEARGLTRLAQGHLARVLTGSAENTFPPGDAHMPETEPVRVLFVCLGNICRSPLAEAVFRHQARQRGVEHRFVVDSAGTSGYHTGCPPDGRSAATARLRGIEVGGASRQLQPRDLRHYHHVVAMDRENLAEIECLRTEAGGDARLHRLRDWDPRPEDGDVPDPYYGGAGGFERVQDMVERCCEALLDDLLGGAPAG